MKSLLQWNKLLHFLLLLLHSNSDSTGIYSKGLRWLKSGTALRTLPKDISIQYALPLPLQDPYFLRKEIKNKLKILLSLL